MDLEEIIVIEDIGTMMTFVDTSFAANNNMRGHTGLAIAFGIGVSYENKNAIYQHEKLHRVRASWRW